MKSSLHTEERLQLRFAIATDQNQVVVSANGGDFDFSTLTLLQGCIGNKEGRLETSPL